MVINRIMNGNKSIHFYVNFMLQQLLGLSFSALAADARRSSFGL